MKTDLFGAMVGQTQTPCLFSPAQVSVASLIGGPLGGAVLLKRNYRVLGAQPRSAMPVLWAFVVTLAAFVVLGEGPRTAVTVLPIALAMGSWRYANRLQGAQIVERLNGGWSLHSWWRVLVIGVIVLGSSLAAFALFELAVVEILVYAEGV